MTSDHYLFDDVIITSLLSSSEPIKRDFTYVTDAVDGFITAMDHTPRRCGEVYNLGSAESVSMETIIVYLEEELEQKAIVVRCLDGTLSDGSTFHLFAFLSSPFYRIASLFPPPTST